MTVEQVDCLVLVQKGSCCLDGNQGHKATEVACVKRIMIVDGGRAHRTPLCPLQACGGVQLWWRTECAASWAQRPFVLSRPRNTICLEVDSSMYS